MPNWIHSFGYHRDPDKFIPALNGGNNKVLHLLLKARPCLPDKGMMSSHADIKRLYFLNGSGSRDLASCSIYQLRNTKS